MPKFPNWGTGTDVSGTNLANDVPNIVTKAATTSITSNITLANDSELVNIALEIGTWEIEAMYWYTCVATGAGNLKAGWLFSGTLSGTPNRMCVGQGAGGTAAPTAVTNMNMSAVAYNTAVTYGGNNTAIPFHSALETASLFVVTAAGNLSVQFAQGTSNATPTVVQAGSRVKCRRIA